MLIHSPCLDEANLEHFSYKGADVWTCVLSRQQPTFLKECLSVLNESERAKALDKICVHDRESQIVAHGLKRIILSQVLGFKINPADLAFASNKYGKPLLRDGPDIHFSLSHTKGAVAFSCSANGPVGVDIEFMDRCVSGPEFYQQWTEYEACLKATGRPIEFRSKIISKTIQQNWSLSLCGLST